MLSPSPHCKALIAQFEGCAERMADGRYRAYPDPGTGGAPWTIGFGATGPNIGKGTIWTLAQCEAQFDAHIAQMAGYVRRLLGAAPTTQNQFDALVALAYNIGPGNLADSTLLKLHVVGNYKGAAAEWPKWNKSGGKVLAGLTRRRAAEAQLYVTP